MFRCQVRPSNWLLTCSSDSLGYLIPNSASAIEKWGSFTTQVGQITTCQPINLWQASCGCLKSSLTCCLCLIPKRKQLYTVQQESGEQERQSHWLTLSQSYMRQRMLEIQIQRFQSFHACANYASKDSIWSKCQFNMTLSGHFWSLICKRQLFECKTLFSFKHKFSSSDML